MSRRRSFNPFYAIVLLASIAFCITACAYGVMTVRGLKGDALGANQPAPWLIAVMDERGSRMLGTEVAILGLAAIAAMATDRYWRQRETSQNDV